MIDPPVWTDVQLDAARLQAIAAFSSERLQEPLEDYLEAFDLYQGHVEELLETTIDLSQLDVSALEVLADQRLRDVFRYLAGPPISEDDLKVLAEAKSFARSTLSGSVDLVPRLISTVRQVLDRRRFAWVAEDREPTEAERSAAVLASAALMAASRTQTRRRTLGKEQQEERVKAALRGLGFAEVSSRSIPTTLARAPSAGEFCGESMLGTRKGDVIVRLWDDRVMPIECKVSNSATNSVKRLNNDAAAKATVWKREFGERQVVPTAVLSGVYKLHNLRSAQANGLTLFWAHDLTHLTEWIETTRSR